VETERGGWGLRGEDRDFPARGGGEEGLVAGGEGQAAPQGDFQGDADGEVLAPFADD
jgi:hypothetical protein